MVIAVRVVSGELALIATARIKQGDLIAPVYGLFKENQEFLPASMRRIRDRNIILIDDLCSVSYAQNVVNTPSAMLDFPSDEESETFFAPVCLRALKDLEPGDLITIRYNGEPSANYAEYIPQYQPNMDTQDYDFGLSPQAQQSAEEEVPLLELVQSPPLLAQEADSALAGVKVESDVTFVVDVVPIVYSLLKITQSPTLVSVLKRSTETVLLVMRKRVEQGGHCVLSTARWRGNPSYVKITLLLQTIVFEWFFKWTDYATLSFELPEGMLFDMTDFGSDARSNHVSFTRSQIQTRLDSLQDVGLELRQTWT